MSKLIRYTGDQKRTEVAITGRGKTWWPGELRMVSDAIASALLLSGGSWEIERGSDAEDELNEVTASTDPVTGAVEVIAGQNSIVRCSFAKPASGDATGITDHTSLQESIAGVGEYGGQVHIHYGVYVVNKPIQLKTGVHITLSAGTCIKAPNAFTVSASLTSGSTSVSCDTTRLYPNYYVSGNGLDDANRVSAVGDGAITLENAATITGVISMTVYPVFNVIEALSGVSDWSMTCSEWATIDGNISAQPHTWRAAHDAKGSGLYLNNSEGWYIDGISFDNHHYHGIFDVVTNAINGGESRVAGRVRCKNNGVRGFHARTYGAVGNWPGTQHKVVENLLLEGNGRSWVSHTGAEGYDQTNGGLFVHTNSTQFYDFQHVRAYNEMGEVVLMYGSDDANADKSKNLRIGEVVVHNSGHGIHLGLGVKNVSFGDVTIVGDHVASTNGASVSLSSIADEAIQSLEGTGEKYRVVATVAVNANISDANFAKFRVGGQIFMSESLTGNGARGNAILAINGRNLKVMSLDDPLGKSTDDRDGLCLSQTPGGAGAMTINGAQASVGASNYANPRKISIYSASNLSSRTFTVTGTDYTGAALIQSFSGPNNSTVYSPRLFLTVTQVSIDGAAAGAAEVGTCLSRPYTTAATNVSCVYRGGRLNGIYVRHSGASSGDVQNISFGNVIIDGYGYIGVELSSSSSGFKTRDFSIGSLKISRCRFAVVAMDYDNLYVSNMATDSICRGVGTESAANVSNFDSSSSGGSKQLHIGRLRHRHTESSYSGNMIALNLQANTTDSFIGPSYIQSANVEKIRVNGTRAVLTNPRDDSGVALTVGAGNIGGSGSPVVWVPA